MEEAAATQRDQSTDTESVIIQPDLDPPAMCPDEPDRREPKTNLNQGEIFKALEIIERDSLAIAGSFTSLFASLRFALSEVSFDSSNFLFGSWEKEMKYLFFFFVIIVGYEYICWSYAMFWWCYCSPSRIW